MKRLFLLTTVLFSLAASAQNVDDIIKKYSDNLGGLEKFRAIKSAKMSGNVTVQGMELPITIQIINNRAVRTDVDVMGSAVISSYIDGNGWKQNPFAGSSDPEDMTEKELSDSKSQTQLVNSLMDYKASGAKVELLGKETTDGAEAFKIKLTAKDGDETTYYIHSSEYRIIKTVSQAEVMGQTAEIETYFSDPKQINGVTFYMGRKQTREGEVFQEIVFNTIELDVPIDEAAFKKP